MTPATVPMISPDGKSGDIPQARAQDAIAAGFKPAMVMTSPDGQLGYIPQDRAADALKAGFKAGQPISPDSAGMQPASYMDHLKQFASDAYGTTVPGELHNAFGVVQKYLGDKAATRQQQNEAAIAQGKPQPNSPAVNTALRTASDVVGLNTSGTSPQAAGLMVAGAVVPLPTAIAVAGYGAHEAYKNKGALADLVTNGEANPQQVQEGLTGLSMLAGGAAGVRGMSPELAAKMATARGAMEAVKKAPAIAKEAAFPGPQGKVMSSAAELPVLAKSGVEHIFQSAAPTSMNKGFRENLNVAAPDLADIARKVDISEAKGGVINPDMRVRATVTAIREHQSEMYEQERAPQIQRNANAPVKVGTNDNAIRGLEYLETTAGDVADSQIAKKALEERTLTVEEADKLAQLANKTLRSYEKMTPEGKMQLQATNPKIGGIKALDSELGSNLNDTLKSNGEIGLRDYERRYAALSVVRDQLESRMNATELKQEGMFGFAGRVTRPAVKLFTEGPSGVPSASQAAVADVNIGRSLQLGMSKLKASGISAKRATK